MIRKEIETVAALRDTTATGMCFEVYVLEGSSMVLCKDFVEGVMNVWN